MLYEIENEYIKAIISDFGATLVKFINKKNNIDIVLGFDNEKEYIEKWGSYFGASVGRNANRIGNSEITINGLKYKLSSNDHGNQLHGGVNNFSKKHWEVKEQNSNSIRLIYFSKDLEEGFPGNLYVEVCYKLENNCLLWEYSGTSDKDTIFNMTNHSYFNLGDNDILNHKLKIYTGLYSPTDENGLSLSSTVKVENTPYDFRDFNLIGKNISKLNNGIDNNYVFENLQDKLMAELNYDSQILKIYSDLPDMHVFTSGGIKKIKGKNNKIYNKACGICFECQYYPNGINYDAFIKPILKKNNKIKHYIKYELETK